MALADTATAVTTAIDQLDLAGLDTAAPTEITDALQVMKVAASKLDAKIAAATHAADAAGAFIGTGSRDTAEWLAKATGTSAGRNRNAAALGAAMAKSDELSSAVASGSLSTDKALVVVGAAASETVDAELLTAVADLPLGAVKPEVERWRARQHPERDADLASVQRSRRCVRLTPADGGMTRIDGLLDPLSASHIRGTLDALMSKTAFDDTGRTRDQRRADALTQLCVAEAKGDINGGRSNATLLVTVAYDTVVKQAAERGVTNVGTTLDADAVRQLACNAGIHRVITGPQSSVLDFGHETRLVSANLFKALVVRDQHCRWPGCTIRATWCDAHHITEWQDGGATDLSNTALFCHHHHHVTHQPGWTMTGSSDHIEIHHPDGSTEVSRPPGARATGAETIGRHNPRTPARSADQLALI